MSQLRQQIETYITKELTTGKIAQGLEPFNYSQISAFINKNNNEINELINDVINDTVDDTINVCNDQEYKDINIEDCIAERIFTDVNSNLEPMSIINYYDLKFTFEYVKAKTFSKNGLIFMFYNCTILKPGFTSKCKLNFKAGTKVKNLDIKTIERYFTADNENRY